MMNVLDKFEFVGNKDMKYMMATAEMADSIYNIYNETIKTVYPRYYPKEVVDFFLSHHSKEHVFDGIISGNTGVLKVDDLIVGSGCFDENHITGLYVLPDFQKQGYGSYIIECLEAEIMKKYDTAVLEASLPAVFVYERKGYRTTGHGIIELENDVKLVYEIMEKTLKDS